MNAFALMATLGLDSSKYDSGLDKAKSAGSALGKGLATAAKVGIAAVGTATTAVVGFGAASVKTGMEFDKSMSQVAATMGMSVDDIQNNVNGAGDSFNKLRDFAQEMGRTTAFSASQAADALNYMALAGYDAETSMNMLPNVLNLAAAGDMELARASDMVTDAATAFGMVLENGQPDIQRTTQMVDEMAKAASTGNTSVEQLGDAFLTVGGLAKELNGGMVTLADGTKKPVDGVQELEIALTAMANAGVKGSEAGTHMRNMLLKLSSPTDDGVAQMEALGVSVFDAGGQMRSLKDIMGDLNGALGNLTQEQKIQAISDLFNTRDMASAEALLGAVGQDWDKIGESILNAYGAAQKMAETQLDNLAGDVTLFKSALEGAKIAISDTLSPSLREFVQFGTDGLSQLTAAFQEGGLSGAMETFGTLLSDGLNMIISKLPEFVNAGMELLGALGQGLLDNLPVIIDAANQIISQLLSGLLKALPSLIKGAVEIIKGLAQGLLDALPELVKEAPTIIKSLGEGLVGAVKELIPMAADIIIGLAMALTDPDTLYAIVESAADILVALADGLVDAIPKLVEAIPQIISNLVAAIIASLPKILEAAVQIILALAKGLITSIPQLIAAIPEIILALAGGLIRGVVKIAEVGTELVKGLWQGIKDRWNRLVSDFKNMVGGFIDRVKGWFGIHSPSRVFADIGKQLDAGLAQGITSNMGLVDNAMDSLSDYTSGSFVNEINASGIESGTSSSSVEDILLKYLPDLANMQVVLNTGELVGATAGAYDTEFGSIANRGSRR